MTMLGVFCRVNHPAGYGGQSGTPYGTPPEIVESLCTNQGARFNARRNVREVLGGPEHRPVDEAAIDTIVNRLMPPQLPMTGAHGYVTLIVVAYNGDEMRQVADRLARWFQWKDRNDTWYAGTFDLVLATYIDGIPNDDAWALYPTDLTRPASMWRERPDGGDWVSIGDNRAVAYLSARDVLERDDGNT